MTRPYYCPNCAASLDALKMGENFIYLDNGWGGTDYDTFCWRCQWSGTIEPDDEAISDKFGFRVEASEEIHE